MLIENKTPVDSIPPPANFGGIRGVVFGRTWMVIAQIPQLFFTLLAKIANVFFGHFFEIDENERLRRFSLDIQRLSITSSDDMSSSLAKKNPVEDKERKVSLNKENIDIETSEKSEESRESEESRSSKESEESEPFKQMTEGIEHFVEMGAAKHHPKTAPSLVPVNSIEDFVNSKLIKEANSQIEISKNLLKEIKDKKHVSDQDYLTSFELLEKSQDALRNGRNFPFDFPNRELFEVQNQKMLDELDKVHTNLTASFCKCIQSQKYPDPKIIPGGSCLFWSISQQLRSEHSQQHFRSLAIKYILKHPDKFKVAIDEVMKKKPEEKIKQYMNSQGGKRAWSKKLKEKLGRPPSQVDLYCDCLENTSSLAGLIEIEALSKELNIQILVFTYQKKGSFFGFKQWDLWSNFGNRDLKNNVIYLFYNENHYQSLIPKAH